MKDEHINAVLESKPFGLLGEAELRAAREHASRCERCRRALEAARLSSLIVRARAAEVPEPSPFFQTKVLAALRERRAGEETWTLWKLWRDAGALVSSMAAAVLLLAGLALAPAPASQDIASAAEPYSAEAVVLEGAQEAELTYGQVLSTIYGDEEGEAK